MTTRPEEWLPCFYFFFPANIAVYFLLFAEAVTAAKHIVANFVEVKVNGFFTEKHRDGIVSRKKVVRLIDKPKDGDE